MNENEKQKLIETYIKTGSVQETAIMTAYSMPSVYRALRESGLNRLGNNPMIRPLVRTAAMHAYVNHRQMRDILTATKGMGLSYPSFNRIRNNTLRGMVEGKGIVDAVGLLIENELGEIWRHQEVAGNEFIGKYAGSYSIPLTWKARILGGDKLESSGMESDYMATYRLFTNEVTGAGENLIEPWEMGKILVPQDVDKSGILLPHEQVLVADVMVNIIYMKCEKGSFKFGSTKVSHGEWVTKGMVAKEIDLYRAGAKEVIEHHFELRELNPGLTISELNRNVWQRAASDEKFARRFEKIVGI